MAAINVRARLTRTGTIFPHRASVATQTVWWLGEKFRFRDESGRAPHVVLADATAPRGFGHVPATLEDLMDQTGRLEGVTEFYGDRATGAGLIIDPAGGRHKVPAALILPLAGQLFAEVTGLTPGARSRVAGRDAVAYVRVLTGTDHAGSFRQDVRLTVAGAYVLSRTAERTGITAHTEVTALDEGVVTSADVTPPVTAS